VDGTARLVRALLTPEAFPERPTELELRQTHISYLIFTPEFVYKIKKHVDFGFLDFTTLERRRFFCDEEARLNRRLAPDTYLDVIGITERHGSPFMGGDGEPVEYAVKMRRLQEKKMLGRMLDEGEATVEDIRRVAAAAAAFHLKADSTPYISRFGSLESIRKNTEENFEQTTAFVGKGLSAALYGRIREFTEGFISGNSPMLERRVREGFIRDCHGDMHSEHVFVEDGIQIIDCIEFNERFRYSDVIADIAFLSMDLDFHNRHGLGRTLDSAYFEKTGDYEGRRLMDFYRCYRAYVRGKVEGFKSLEPEVDDGERDSAFLRSAYHFYLSGLYASGGFGPMLIAVAGPSGTGKSTLAAEISKHTGFVHLSSDRIRKELAGLPMDERWPEPFGFGIYSEGFTERTYGELIRRGARFLSEGRSVVLDATFGRRAFVLKAKQTAERMHAQFRVVECTALNSTIKERLLSRQAAPGASDADWEIYIRQKAVFEEIKEAHARAKAEEPLPERSKAVFRSIFG